MSAAEAVIPEWRLGDRLLRARKHAGMEQTEIAKHLGVSRALVSMWERDLSEPRVTHIRTWAEVTGVQIEWLLGLAGSRTCFADLVPALKLVGAHADL